jgi:hypothetical protein
VAAARFPDRSKATAPTVPVLIMGIVFSLASNHSLIVFGVKK